MQRVFKWELISYFGLTYAQVEEMQENWNLYYNDALTTVLNSVPAVSPYNSTYGVAYWQWADSYLTRKRNIPPAPSVANSTNTVTGYPEYYYWLHYYCNPDNQGAMSDTNWQYFNIEMYNSESDPSVNMEYLFNLVDPDTGGDPAQNSLFNLTTLKYLVDAGQKTPNII